MTLLRACRSWRRSNESPRSPKGPPHGLLLTALLHLPPDLQRLSHRGSLQCKYPAKRGAEWTTGSKTGATEPSADSRLTQGHTNTIQEHTTKQTPSASFVRFVLLITKHHFNSVFLLLSNRIVLFGLIKELVNTAPLSLNVKSFKRQQVTPFRIGLQITRETRKGCFQTHFSPGGCCLCCLNSLVSLYI